MLSRNEILCWNKRRYCLDRECDSNSRSQSVSPCKSTRSRSSSLELEVDSPPPLPQSSSSPMSSTSTSDALLSNTPKGSETFSMSALLRQDEPKILKSSIFGNPLEAFKTSCSSYNHTFIQRPILSPFPWLAAIAFHHGQPPNINSRYTELS